MKKNILLIAFFLAVLSVYSREFIVYRTPGLESHFLVIETFTDSNGMFSSSHSYICSSISVQSDTNAVILSLGDATCYQTKKTKENKTGDIKIKQLIFKIKKVDLLVTKNDNIIYHEKKMTPDEFLREANRLNSTRQP